MNRVESCAGRLDDRYYCCGNGDGSGDRGVVDGYGGVVDGVGVDWGVVVVRHDCWR